MTRPGHGSMTRLGQRSMTHPVNYQARSTTRPGQRSTPDPVNGQHPTRIMTRPGQQNPAACDTHCHALPHAPSLLVAREGACEGISGQFWYLQTRIEIVYTVVYLLCMFETFTDMKMRIEPYLHLGIRVFSRIFCISLWFRKYIW